MPFSNEPSKLHSALATSFATGQMSHLDATYTFDVFRGNNLIGRFLTTTVVGWIQATRKNIPPLPLFLNLDKNRMDKRANATKINLSNFLGIPSGYIIIQWQYFRRHPWIRPFLANREETLKHHYCLHSIWHNQQILVSRPVGFFFQTDAKKKLLDG